MVVSAPSARYDSQADVLYLISDQGALARSVEVAPGITIEYDDAGNMLGVEILRASRVLPENVVASLHAKQAGVL
ncbi:MAG: DUF2283 domain-containing protein [Phycisphaerae bacterium]